MVAIKCTFHYQSLRIYHGTSIYRKGRKDNTHPHFITKGSSLILRDYSLNNRKLDMEVLETYIKGTVYLAIGSLIV